MKNLEFGTNLGIFTIDDASFEIFRESVRDILPLDNTVV
jgi:hypothetical protein